jgi:DNA excision repair protein ERCC-4
LRGHADLRPEDITAIVDTREQAPLDLLVPSIVGKLPTADYSVLGLEHLVAVERKSLPDLLGCVGRDRDRFEACIQRMKAYETRVLVIEAGWGAIEAGPLGGQWRSRLTPTQVKAALYSWAKHVTIIPAGDREAAARAVSGILLSAARQRWKELASFQQSLKLVSGEGA